MESQPNRLLWNAVFVLILVSLALGIYVAAEKVEYQWRWQRIPQYIYYLHEEPLRAAFDGSLEVSQDERQVRLVSDYDSSQVQILVKGEDFDIVQASDGALIFEGDVLAYDTSYRIGPITRGLLITLEISLYSIVFAIIIGLLAGLARVSKNPALRKLAVTYVELIRGTPLLVQIFIFYFFIGTVFDLERFTAGVAALSVFSGAYIAEIVRAGIQSIARGQMEAARSLGMNYVQAMRYIILPQALKRTLPPMAGQFITLIKDSSLVSVISITDLTKAGREVVASTFSPFEVWFTVAALYLVLTSALSYLVQRLERRMAASD